MREQHRGGGWPLALTIIAVLIAIWYGGTWVEDRFGSSAVLMVFGGVFGITCFSAGALLIHANTRHTLNSAAQFNHDLASTERHRSGTYKELLRGDNMRARIEVIDAKRIDQLAQKRADVLLDVERQRMALEQKPQQWTYNSDVEYEEIG